MSSKNKPKGKKVRMKKWAMEWGLEKDRLMKELKMSEIKFNLKSKFKDRKEKRKNKMQARRNRMTSAWKEISKVKCMIKNKTKKDRKEKKVGQRKWDQSIMTKRKKI